MYFPQRVDNDITLTLLSLFEAKSFYELVDRNRKHLGRWFNWVDTYKSVSGSAAFAKSNLQRLVDGSAMGCLIWYREHAVGWMELPNINHTDR